MSSDAVPEISTIGNTSRPATIRLKSSFSANSHRADKEGFYRQPVDVGGSSLSIRTNRLRSYGRFMCRAHQSGRQHIARHSIDRHCQHWQQPPCALCTPGTTNVKRGIDQRLYTRNSAALYAYRRSTPILSIVLAKNGLDSLEDSLAKWVQLMYQTTNILFASTCERTNYLSYQILHPRFLSW